VLKLNPWNSTTPNPLMPLRIVFWFLTGLFTCWSIAQASWQRLFRGTNSLGIAEHWNNSRDKQYTRNLSPTGAGIELISIQPELNMSVAITSPAAGATIHPGDKVKLQASVSPGRASISKVEYYCNGKAIGVSSISPYIVVWSNVRAGNYSITAVATDTNNFSGLSATVPVSVRSE
jgi:hypothetical protein